MPVIWNYLTRHFLRYFFLCLLTLVCVLLISRMMEIAKFIAFTSNPRSIYLFIVYQIPYILPFGVPISALIGAFILSQKLSHSHELSAMRACGFSLKQITFPILAIGWLLSIGNFYFVSEVAPLCRKLSLDLLFSSATNNPLTLLKKSKFLNLKDSYIDLKIMTQDKEAKDLIFAFKRENENRITLALASKLILERPNFSTIDTTIIQSLDSANAQSFDGIMIENEPNLQFSADFIPLVLREKKTVQSIEMLPLQICLEQFRDATTHTQIHIILEVCKRLFFGFAAFAFLLIGLTYGLGISRVHKNQYIAWILGLSGFIFVGYFVGKNFSENLILPLLFYFIPLIVSLLLCNHKQHRFEKGIE